MTLSPNLVCVAQLTTRVKVTGTNLSPLQTRALNGPLLELPVLTLSRTKDIDGAAATEGAIKLPDDSSDPGASRVRWMSQTEMTFEIFPELALQPGLYDFGVANPGGASSNTAAALLAVPPPTLSAVVPDLACGDQDNSLELRGDFFIKVGGLEPIIRIASLRLNPTSMSDCRTLPGPGQVSACKKMTVRFSKKTVPLGTQRVTVENPSPAGCTSSEPLTVTLVPEPTVAKIEPDLVCTEQGANTLKVTGTGFLTVDGVAPRLNIAQGTQQVSLDTVASDCTVVTGPLEVVRSCTTLSATLPQASLPPASYLATVTNPAPAACSSPSGVGLVVAPAPVLVTALPDIACTADGAVQVVLTGTGFLTVNGTAPAVAVGTQTLPATASNCVPVTGSLQTVTTCTTLTLSVPQSSATGAQPVVVTNPPPAGCSSASGKVITFFDKPAISAVAPGATCTLGVPTGLVITGTGFVQVGTTSPGVTVGASSYPSTASNCIPVMGTTATVSVCTTLTLANVGGGFGVGDYPVTVTNPAPVGCASTASASATFRVTPTPTLTAVAPAVVCRGKATLILTGTNLSTNMGATIGSTPATAADTVTANGAGTSATATFPATIPIGGPYSVTVGSGACAATLAAQVTVVPGPQLFFVDPSIIYNGIAIQASVYGGGVTGTIQSVTITPSAGGTSQVLAITPVTGQVNQVQVRLPAGLAPGEYDVELTDLTACKAELKKAFKVTNTINLALAGIVPGFGWQNSETAVTVTAANDGGAGFSVLPRAYLSPSGSDGGSAATALGAVSFVDSRTLTGVAPSGLLGTYDLIVVNPDQRVGVLTQAFRAVASAPPTISTLAPGSVANTNPQTFTINGADFRMPQVTLSCVDGAGVALATSPTATVTGSTATTVSVSFDASAGGAACVVRVTDADNGTFADFSALVITNPAQNLYTATFGPNLLTARRAPVALGGDASSAARFLHVMGGDNGTTVFDTVESASLSLLGVPSSFRAQKYKLTSPRTYAGGARVGRYLYVAGGSSADGGALATVERAAVLDPNRREKITGVVLEVLPNSGVGAGVWFYRVAAVTGSSDLFNPDGENLPSDPFPLQLPALTGSGVSVKLQWATEPTATKYRVYRSPISTVVPEQLIAEVNAPTTTFTDLGGAPILNENPLPVGSTGAWKAVATMPVRREGPGVTWGMDPSDAGTAYVYVFGGRANATTAHSSYDILPISFGTNGAQTVGTPLVGGNPLSSGRWQLGSSFATRDTSPVIPAGKTFVYALSGFAANGTAVLNDAEGAQVQSGGQLSAWTTLPNLNRAGCANLVAGNFVYAFGGGGGAPVMSVVSGQICATGVGGCGPTAVAPQVNNWNAGAATLQSLLSPGGALHGAYIYLAGGTTSTGPLTVSNRVEYRLW